MRLSLPIWHCLNAETQEKLAALMGPDSGPEPEDKLVPWVHGPVVFSQVYDQHDERLREIDRFMRQPRSRGN